VNKDQFKILSETLESIKSADVEEGKGKNRKQQAAIAIAKKKDGTYTEDVITEDNKTEDVTKNE